MPWESAATGEDVTPREDADHQPILTGALEEHIVADVAWAANQYALWTGDEAFLAGAGRPLLLDTASPAYAGGIFPVRSSTWSTMGTI